MGLFNKMRAAAGGCTGKAGLGYAPAQCNLGTLYREDRGVTRDPAEAAKWFEVAARQGDAQAESNIGYMYNYGEGVAQDYGQAVE